MLCAVCYCTLYKWVAHVSANHCQTTEALSRHRFERDAATWHTRSEYFVLLQDGAPSHRVKDSCAAGAKDASFIPPTLWPPNSPDLNPVDYSVWSVLHERVYRTKISDVDELKRRISESRRYWTCRWRVAPASARLRSRWRHISSTWCKDGATYYTFDDFWETTGLTAAFVCRYSTTELKCTCNYIALTTRSDTSSFPR